MGPSAAQIMAQQKKKEKIKKRIEAQIYFCLHSSVYILIQA